MENSQKYHLDEYIYVKSQLPVAATVIQKHKRAATELIHARDAKTSLFIEKSIFPFDTSIK